MTLLTATLFRLLSTFGCAEQIKEGTKVSEEEG